MNILQEAINVVKTFTSSPSAPPIIATIETPAEVTYDAVKKYQELKDKLYPIKIRDTWVIGDATEEVLHYVSKVSGAVICDCEYFETTQTYCPHIICSMQESMKMKHFQDTIAKKTERLNQESIWLLKLAQTRLRQICRIVQDDGTCNNYYTGKLHGILYALHVLLRQKRF